MFEKIISFIHSLYPEADSIPLHEPKFKGHEKFYVSQSIDSTYVSSIGPFVDKFESLLSEHVGSKFAIATINGTAALHASLLACGVLPSDEVLTQPLTFAATVNAIKYTGATPIFLDVDKNTMSLSPEKLSEFLDKFTRPSEDGYFYNKISGKRIKACVPMHTFGHPGRIDQIVAICKKHQIDVIEDAAEALGSTYKGKHTGTYGKCGIFSFNGNKIITSGGGGAIITDDEILAQKLKHLTTTGRVSHPWEISHDTIAYNYRMPNINAALGCAQLEQLHTFLKRKRNLANTYLNFFQNTPYTFFTEPAGACSNYWLNCILLKDKDEQNSFLKITHRNNILTRPPWVLMHKLNMFNDCETHDLETSEMLQERIVSLPSSVPVST